MLSLALLVGIALVGYVGKKSRGLKRLSVEEEAQEARESLIPSVAGGSAGEGSGYGGVAVNGWGEEEEDRGRRM